MFRYFILPIVMLGLRLWIRSLRIRRIGEPADAAILSFWHQGIFPVIAVIYRMGIAARYHALVSRSHDGSRLAAVLRKLGFNVVLGSSSSGGLPSALSMIRMLHNRQSVLITPDGPRGPAGSIKDGVLAISNQTGAPIQPVSVSCENAWKLGSWDHALLPKPGSIVWIKYGDPFAVSSARNHENWIQFKDELREAMYGLQADRSMEIPR